MKPHKWAKEIKAWADGVEIEIWDMRWNKWVGVEDPTWNDEINEIKYRIKPQPKEPQYLYVLRGQGKSNFWLSPFPASANNIKTIGKIKLEVDDD